MANKLTKEQAEDVILKARDEIHTFPSLRLGQAVFNLLTLKQISNVISDERDFFYIKDDEKVLEMFMEYCVEKSDGES